MHTYICMLNVNKHTLVWCLFSGETWVRQLPTDPEKRLGWLVKKFFAAGCPFWHQPGETSKAFYSSLTDYWVKEHHFFYSAPQCSHCKRCTSYSNSIRLSHAGIVSKWLHVAWCSLHCQIAKCVQFSRNQKIFPRDDPFPLKSWLKLTHPSPRSNKFWHVLPCIASMVRASERSSIMTNRKSYTDFPTSHQPRLYAAPNFLKMGIRYLNLSSFGQFRQ